MAVHPLWSIIETAANDSPDALAVVTAEKTWTNAEFAREVRAIAAELRRDGVRPRDIVLSMCTPTFEWFVLCALAFEGAVSVTTHRVENADVVGATHIVTNRSEIPESVAGLTVIRIDDAFMTRAREIEPAYRPIDSIEPDDVVRLTLTSGTTGKPKAVGMTADSIRRRIRVIPQFLTPELGINLMGFSSAAGFFMAFANLVLGRPNHFLDQVDDQLPAFLVEHDIEAVTASPISATWMLDAIEQSGIDVRLEVVRLFGSEVSPALLNRVQSLTHARVDVTYSSTEAGIITQTTVTLDSPINNVGHPIAGASVVIVDDDGTAVPTGVVGFIRVCGASMSTEYYRNAALTAQFFVDGWFVTGDRGYLTEAGELVVDGRLNAILNIGGVKIDAALMERLAATVPGVVDVGLASAVNANGAPRLVCALVVNNGTAAREVDALLRREFPQAHPSVFISLDSLPRNIMGKLARDELQAVIAPTVAGLTT
ncbi:MAG: class I adenylate-forming enzyme family protein [Microbacteriaceae bacterium]